MKNRNNTYKEFVGKYFETTFNIGGGWTNSNAPTVLEKVLRDFDYELKHYGDGIVDIAELYNLFSHIAIGFALDDDGNVCIDKYYKEPPGGAIDDCPKHEDTKSYELFRKSYKVPDKILTDDLGLNLEVLVVDFDDQVQIASECIVLGGVSEHEGSYCLERNARKDGFRDDAWITRRESVYIHDEDFWSHVDHLPENYVYSERNDEYVNKENSNVYYGIYNYRGGEGWFRSNEVVEYEDKYYIDSCVASDHGIRWSDSRGEYVHEDDMCEYNGDYENDYNAEYHHLTRVFRFTENTSFGIGFEVEKEDENAVSSVMYEGLHERTDWCKEKDSSLNEEVGYELVSPAFDIFTNELDEDLKDPDIKLLVNAEYSTKCGGHMTLSSSDYTSNELLEGLAGFIPLIYALYDGRMESTYCQPRKKWSYHTGGSGYPAVKLRGNRSIREAEGKVFGAIEFRIFSAIRSVRNLLWRRDLARIMVNNINQSEKDVLRMLVNPKSLIFKHLSKVYSVDQIVNKIKLFVTYSREFNDVKLDMPDLNKVKRRLDKGNSNESTNQLGA